MNFVRRSLFRIILGILILHTLAFAQDHWDVHFGGGFTPTVGDISNDLNTGWNVTAGAGYFINRHEGIVAEYMYDSFGVSSNVLRQLSVPNGSAWINSITLNPMWRLDPHSEIDPYVIVGGGFYRRTVQFTQPTTAVVTVFNPWFGFFSAAVPANQVLGTFTNNTGGVNAGVGVDVRVGHAGAKVFAEARYHWIDTARTRTTIIPVTFGIRW